MFNIGKLCFGVPAVLSTLFYQKKSYDLSPVYASTSACLSLLKTDWLDGHFLRYASRGDDRKVGLNCYYVKVTRN